MLEWKRLVLSVLSAPVALGTLLTLALAGCASPPPGPGPGAPPAAVPQQPGSRPDGPAYNPDGFNLAIVTDISGSMRTEDPQGFNREGAQLAVALASVDDNLALVAFNDELDKIVPLRSMNSLSAQRALSTAIDTLKNSGGTDFREPLQEANRQLKYITTTGQTSVIFLSDGKPEHPNQIPRVLELAQQSGDDGRRIFTIALGHKTDETLLQQIANLSGGNSYKALRADALVDAYLKILGDFYNLFTYDADHRQITVDPSAKRLIYLLIKSKVHPEASLDGSVQHDGSPATPSPAIYRRPPGPQAAFDVMQFDSDLAGTWTCDIDPLLGKVVLLSEVPITFRILPDQPGAQYYEGDSVPYGLEASCGSVEQAAQTARTTVVSVQRWAGDRSGQVVKLRGEQQGSRVLYSGSEFVAQLDKGTGDDAELQTARFEINLSDQGWTHTKETSLRILPRDVPPPNPVSFSGSDLSGEPGSQTLSLGQYWAGQPISFERSLQLANTSSYDLHYEFSASGGLLSAPPPLDMAAGASASVKLSQANLRPGPGRHGGILLVRGRFTDPEYAQQPLADTSIALDLAVHSLSIATALPPLVQPGWAGTVSFPVTMAVPGTVMTVVEPRDGEASLAGLDVSWPRSLDETLVLTVAVPPLTPAGRYEGTFRPGIEGSGLEPAAPITVGFDIGGSKPKIDVEAPQTLRLTSEAAADAEGWVEFPGGIDVVMEHHSPLDLSAAMAQLINTENPELQLSKVDLRMVPKKVTLQPRTHQQLALKVNVGNLPPAGTYAGVVTLRFRNPGEREVLETAELNVTVVVEEEN